MFLYTTLFFLAPKRPKIEKTKYEPHPFHKAPLVKQLPPKLPFLPNYENDSGFRIIFYSSSFSTYLSRRWTFLTRCGESAATEVSRSGGAKEGPAPTEASRFSNGRLSAFHWGLVLRIEFSTYDGHKREATQ